MRQDSELPGGTAVTGADRGRRPSEVPASAQQSASERLLGDSLPMRRLRELVDNVAPLESPVLITGESGTGKELVARTLHERSVRKDGPFVAINVSAIPDGLLESELFGHVKGAFTDAKDNRTGLICAASGGTLFLDEIGEMPKAMQAKLLRVLQERRVRPVGGEEEIPVDFRPICATHTDLYEAIASGAFRNDLYYRIDVIQLELAPLRERGDDILVLARHFLAAFGARLGKPGLRLSAAAAARLCAWHWPGNVRELENCIEHAVGLARGPEIDVDDLPPRLRRAPEEKLEPMRLDDVQRLHIIKVLRLTGGNRVRAAQILGISRRTLYRRLDEWDLHDVVPEP